MRAPGFQHVQEGHCSSQDIPLPPLRHQISDIPLPPLRHQISDADFGSRGRDWFRLGGHTWASPPRGPRLPAGPGQRQWQLHHPRQKAGECQATWATCPTRGSPRYCPDSSRVFGTFFTCVAGGFRKGRGNGNTVSESPFPLFSADMRNWSSRMRGSSLLPSGPLTTWEVSRPHSHFRGRLCPQPVVFRVRLSILLSQERKWWHKSALCWPWEEFKPWKNKTRAPEKWDAGDDRLFQSRMRI